MSVEIAAIYIAVGAISTYLTHRYPSPGQRYAAIGTILVGGLLAGMASNLLPVKDRYLFVVAFGLPFTLIALSNMVGKAVDRLRIRRAG